ncbi:hypothetical protein IT575_04950 [bacterium]|nr:hypothetical protein [bacterium]
MSIKAAIDVGSNSVKLLAAELKEDGGYRVLLDRSTVTGLSRGLTEHGSLSQNAIDDTLECLRSMVAKARELGAQEIVAAGTAALRSASDSQRLTGPAKDELGLDIRIISGDEEARLSRAVALRELAQAFGGAAPRDVIFFDVGGGSTELTWCRKGVVADSASLALGARRCTELAGVKHPVSLEMLGRLHELLERVLAEEAPVVSGNDSPEDDRLAPPPDDDFNYPEQGVCLAGLGGTASNVVWLLQGRAGQDAGDPHGQRVRLSQMDELLHFLAPLSPEQVLEVPNLDPGRADIIYAGISILTALCEFYKAEEFIVIDRGLRYGLLLG